LASVVFHSSIVENKGTVLPGAGWSLRFGGVVIFKTEACGWQKPAFAAAGLMRRCVAALKID